MREHRTKLEEDRIKQGDVFLPWKKKKEVLFLAKLQNPISKLRMSFGGCYQFHGFKGKMHKFVEVKSIAG